MGVEVAHWYLRRLFEFGQFDFVFDIGANEGQYAKLLRDVVGFKGHIYSVEPIPEVAEALAEMARKDGNWSVFQGALDLEKGMAEFNVMAGSQFSSLLAPTEDFEGKFQQQHRVSRVIQVRVITLEEAFENQQKLHGFNRPLLKLDTQGTELRVLQSGLKVLPQIQAVQTEVSFQAIYEGAPEFGLANDAFQAEGYALSCLFPNNMGHFPRLLEMDAIYVRKELFPQMS